ncbi:MAG: transposase [Lentisphaeria bacterium]|nr:transposase [Lentisphaeria bacterium]
MPQSLAKAIFHLVFSTVDRLRVFVLEKMRTDTARYMAGLLGNLECDAIRIGVATDHVHILHILSRTRTIADVRGPSNCRGCPAAPKGQTKKAQGNALGNDPRDLTP